MEMIDKIEAFKKRTKLFSLNTIYLFRSLPNTDESRILGKQLLRSSTSVAANYRAACRARSDAEFFSKISIVVEEADEALFWLELISESGINNSEQLKALQKEAEELVKISNTIRHNKKKK